jgi:hypothetical protein
MRSASHRNLWARGDCAAMPGPDGRPYPALAQHAIREARTLARNIAAVIDGRSSAAFFFYRSPGTMASLGHSQAVGQVLGVRLSGFVAWWLRRTYYLLQMPRWDRRLRIILDWTIALSSAQTSRRWTSPSMRFPVPRTSAKRDARTVLRSCGRALAAVLDRRALSETERLRGLLRGICRRTTHPGPAIRGG